MADEIHKILIIGGGAAGLELATHLGHALGKKGLAEVTLLDATSTHIWKPLLHEVASGTLAEAEERDKSPIYLSPNISVYTA